MKLFLQIKYLLLLAFVPAGVYAQVKVSDKIVLTGTGNQSQVQGLARPDSASSAVNAATVISGSLIYDAAAGTDTLMLQFSPAPGIYTKGMQVNFKSPMTNQGALWLNINGLGAKHLYKNINQPVDSAEVLPGQMVSAVYDGNNFQVISRLNQPCPGGFVEVNNKYCIEQDEHDSLTFFSATVYCADLNSKLCTWSEWYYACQKTSLGLSNMTNNFEYVDDPANYQADLQIRVVGSPTCIESASINTANTTKRRFRCCYYKR